MQVNVMLNHQLDHGLEKFLHQEAEILLQREQGLQITQSNVELVLTLPLPL